MRIKNNLKFFLALSVPLFLLFVFFLAGCAGAPKECRKDADCTPKACFSSAKCEKNVCISSEPKPNCCGNNKCDAPAETKCSCPADCGKPLNVPESGICSGSNGSLSYVCIGSNCYLNLTQSSPVNVPLSMNLGQVNILITATYNEPFDARTQEIKFKFQLESKSKDVVEPKIKKIQILSKDIYGNDEILGESDVNRIIWSGSSEDSFEWSVPLTKFAGTEEAKQISARIFYDYKQKYGAETSSVSDFYLSELTYQLKIVRSNAPVQCIPAFCNDNNEGTLDTCSSYGLCEHKPLPGKCGNFVCEPNENKCTCRIDCGPCEGDAGQNLVYYCKASQCSTKLRIQSKPVSTEDTASLQHFKLSIATTFDEPFDAAVSKFKVSISLDDVSRDFVAPLKITKIQFIENEVKIAEYTEPRSLNARGNSIDAEVPVSYTPANAEEQKALTLKITYNYYYRQQTGTDASYNPIYENIYATDSYSKTMTTPVTLVKVG